MQIKYALVYISIFHGSHKQDFNNLILQNLTRIEEPINQEDTEFLKQLSKKFKKDKDHLVQIWLLINNGYVIETEVLFDTGVDQSCILKNLVSSQFFEQNKEGLRGANWSKFEVSFKLTNVQIQLFSLSILDTFFLTKKLTNNVILGIPFIHKLIPYLITNKGIISQLLDPNALLPFFKLLKLTNSILQENDMLNIQTSQQLDISQLC